MSRGIYIVALLVIAGITSYGIAQSEPVEGDGSTDDVGAVETRQRANLTPEEQQAEAGRVIQRGEDLSRRTQSMLDEARQEHDIIRVTCVNDKLTQVNANLRTAEQRFEQLVDAIEANDTSRRNHEFTVISVLGQKFVVLDREAVQCVGEDIYETGSTRVEIEIDPDSPGENPTVITVPAGVLIPFIPRPSSPTT